MIEPELKLFLLTQQQLENAVKICLAGFVPTTTLFEVLDQFNPGLDGPGKTKFMLNLRALGRLAAATEKTGVIEVYDIAKEVLDVLDNGVTSKSDDVAEFLVEVRATIETLFVTTGQIIKNTEGAASS